MQLVQQKQCIAAGKHRINEKDILLVALYDFQQLVTAALYTSDRMFMR